MSVFFRYAPLLGALLLSASAGFFAGRIATIEASIPHGEIRLVPDTRPRVPVVRIDGVRQGRVSGSIQGDLRFLVAGLAIVPNGSGAFAIDPSLFLREEIEVKIPPGARFVASRRGRKVYPVSAPTASRIAPENRVYFRTIEEAKMRGFEE